MAGAAARGTLGLVLENLNSPGAVLLYSGAISATPASLATQPTGSTGMRLFVVVQGNTSTGTVALAGTAPGGGAANETTPTLPAQPAGQPVATAEAEYLTASVFASVSASGVTMTFAQNTGTIKIYGIQAAKYLIPCETEITEQFKYFSPKEARGLLDKDTHIEQLLKEVAIGKIDQSLYPEDSLYIGYMGVSQSPAVVTIPATPTVLKASALVSGGPFSLTTQPLSPGEVMVITITGSSAVGTIAFAGVNQYGQAATETITANAGGSNGNGTYYSSTVYSAVNASGVSFTGLTGGSCAISGVYGWQYTFTPDLLALYSAALEWYTGTDSLGVPYGFLEEVGIDFGVDKEVKVALKGAAQDILAIGDRTRTAITASQAVALGQPLDAPMVGWNTLLFADALSGTPQTTAYNDVIDGKIAVKVPQKRIWTATNSQLFNRLYRNQREATMELTIDFVNEAQYETFRTNAKEFWALQFQGAYIGSIGGTVYAKSWTWVFPARYEKFARDASKMDAVEAKLSLRAEYEPGVGYSHKLVVVCQQPPSYTS